MRVQAAVGLAPGGRAPTAARPPPTAMANASPRLDEAEDLEEDLEPEQITAMTDVLYVLEAAVRNLDMADARSHEATLDLVRAYDRFRSMVKTLREQALSSRWLESVRAVLDASWGVHEVTASAKAAANLVSLDDQVKTLRNGPVVACMLCNQNCEAGSMRFFNLFGQRPPYEECERTGSRGAFSANSWLRCDLKDLHAKWERLEEAYECEDMKEEMRTMSQTPCVATRELPAEALGTIAVGADCARMFELAMYLQTLPIVLMHDIALRLFEKAAEGQSGPPARRSLVAKPHGDEMAEETLRELELVKRALARPGGRGRLPANVGVPRVQELYGEYQTDLMELLLPGRPDGSAPPERGWRRSFVVHDDDDVPPPIELVRARYTRLLHLTGVRWRQNLYGHDSPRSVVEEVDGREEDEGDERDRSRGQAAKRKRAPRRARRDGGPKRAAVAAVEEEPRSGRRNGVSRRAARAAGRACRRLIDDEATGEGFAETCDEASDHTDVESAQDLEELYDGEETARRRSLQSHAAEQMADADADGFSAVETQAALAASAAPAGEAPVQPPDEDVGAGVVPPAPAPAPAPAPSLAAQRAARLGDDVLALARDMISDGEGDRFVWESLQSAGAALHAVKRRLVAENRR